MTTQEVIQKFKDAQLAKNVPEAEIDKTLFIASNVALAKTIKEVKENSNPEVIEKFSTAVKDQQELYNLEKMEKFSKEVVNEKGETLSDLLNRHLDAFLSQL